MNRGRNIEPSSEDRGVAAPSSEPPHLDRLDATGRIWGSSLLYATVVFALGLIATPAAIALLDRLRLVDVPNPRSSHSRPTIRGAGIGVALVATAVLTVAGVRIESGLVVVAFAAGAYAALGLADDLRDLSVQYRLPLQVLIAGIAVSVVGTAEGPVLMLAAVVGVVGYLNAFNFMDGINGISGLHAAGVGVTWAAAGLLSDVIAGVLLGAMLAASALAFLPFNFPHARAFLGDVGSYFFGGWIGVSAVALYGRLPLLVIILPLAPYAADTAWTLFRRMRRGETWYEAHREHVYQRLVASGWSHTRSAGLVGGLTVAAGAGAVASVYVIDGLAGTVLVLSLIGASIVGYLALPAWTAREREQAAA